MTSPRTWRVKLSVGPFPDDDAAKATGVAIEGADCVTMVRSAVYFQVDTPITTLAVTASVTATSPGEAVTAACDAVHAALGTRQAGIFEARAQTPLAPRP